MSIFQRKERQMAWWVDFRANGRRIRRPSPVQTLEGAIEFEIQLRTQMSQPEPEAFPVSSQSTFAEFAQLWMTDYVAIANRPSTIHEKWIALKSRLLPAFGHLPIGAITTNMVDARIAEWHRAGTSIKRANNVATILRCALRCAVEWGYIAQAPLIRHHRYIPPVPKYLTSAESERLLASMEPGFWRTLVLFLLRTGVRFGEAAALRWEDLELDASPAFVIIRRAVCNNVVAEPKTRASRRTIALTPDIVVALRALRYNRPKGDWVFKSPLDLFYRPERTGHFLKEACRKAGVPVITWHKLRHSCASQLMARGVPLVAVKELLGHTSLDVTSIYTHVAPNLAWEYMQRLTPARTPEPGVHLSPSLAA